jgi:SAM-dependent methyltransferase
MRYFGAGLQREIERLEAQSIALSGELAAEAKLLRLKPGLKVLDAGCGSGAVTRWIAKLVAPSKVIGMDHDPTFVLAARKEARRQRATNIDFREGDIDKMEFADATFDLTYCRLVLPFLKNPLRALLELKRVTRPGGRVAVVGFAGMFSHPEPKTGLMASEKIAKYLNRGQRSWATSYDGEKLMASGRFRSVETYSLPEFASQRNHGRLKELLKPITMQQDIYGEGAVKAKFISRRQLQPRETGARHVPNPPGVFLDGPDDSACWRGVEEALSGLGLRAVAGASTRCKFSRNHLSLSIVDKPPAHVALPRPLSA